MNACAQLFWLEQKHGDVPADDEWLTPPEREQLERLHVPKRRLDWRLGRFTAKCAIAAYLHWPTDRIDQIEIRRTPNGAPEATILDQPPAPSISISHCSGVGMCLLGPAGTAIGCDLELVEPRTRQFIKTFFSKHEEAELSWLAYKESSIATNIIWSAKESYLKATGEGLTRDTREVEVIVGSALERVSVAIRETQSEWQPFGILSREGAAAGFWQLNGNMVRTVFGSQLQPLCLM